MNNYVQLLFTDLEPAQQEVLVAQLAEAGFEGFEESEQELKAFIPEKKYDRHLIHEMLYKYQLHHTEQLIPEQNWNSSWESNFQPVLVDDFIAIRADFHETIKGVEHEIVITPKMSFGTGHHATTQMMVQQMRSIDFAGKKVFDFGTGTGILAILAERLGAESVVAIDNDDWSIANAAENFERNQCCRIILGKAEVLPESDKYDIILANINKLVILDNFSSLVDHLSPAGILLLSGLLAEDERDILIKAADHGLRSTGKGELNNWIFLRFNR